MSEEPFDHYYFLKTNNFGTTTAIAAFTPDATCLFLNPSYKTWMQSLFQTDITPGMQLPVALARLPEVRKSILEQFARAAQGEDLSQVIEIREEGAKRYYEIFHGPIRKENGEIIGVSQRSRDITTLKIAEENWKCAHERLLTVLDGLGALVYVADFATHEILFVNRYGARVFGEVTGKLCWQSLQAGQTGPCAFCTNEHLLDAAGKPTGLYQWEFQNTINRHWYHIHDRAIPWTDGRLVRLETAFDITTRRQMEETLRESEERLRLALSAANQAMFDVNMQTGEVTVSPEYATMLGYDPEGFQETRDKWLARVHPEDRKFVEAALQDYLADTQTVNRFVYRKRTRSGAWIWVRSRGRVIQWDAEGKPLRRLGTVTDITEHVRADEKIARSLQEKELLLKEVHHRVKNNIQVISGLLDLQASSTENPEVALRLKESRNKIRAMALIHEKLYMSDDLSNVNFSDYVRDMAEELASFYRTNLSKIEMAIESDGVHLGIDKAIPCGLIMNEMLSNALKHAFPGGGPGEIEIVLRKTAKNEAEIIVRDNGQGLPQEIDPHTTLSAGLYLVHGLVQNQLHGEMTVLRKRGTEFRIKFPL